MPETDKAIRIPSRRDRPLRELSPIPRRGRDRVDRPAAPGASAGAGLQPEGGFR